MLTNLQTLHGSITLPTFFPDGTLGVVRGVDSSDLENCRVEGLVINAYHLLYHNLGNKIEQLEDVHQFMRWPHPIITDSGGFQVMSLIHEHLKSGPEPERFGAGKITDEGIVFRLSRQRKTILTPENSIQTQLGLGTDIAIVLDDCTRPEMGQKDQERSVARTLLWAKRSKEEFERKTRKSSTCEAKVNKPLLFAVVQGGNDKKLRQHCAEGLIKLGFDGYCFGGFPVQDGQFLSEIVGFTAQLLPDDKPKYALGVGKPENIAECVKMGYQIFDCVVPTREARHQKLYVW